MRVKLDLRKSLEENAASYFEKAKKSKSKLNKIQQVIKKAQDELSSIDQKELIEEKSEQKEKKREKKWFEKFRWFISSDGFLCIGGRDATSNEIVVKKHTTAADIVFHTELSGSPFFVVQSEGKIIPEQTIMETSQATAAFSRAWKQGLGYLEVFHVKPEQVTKEAKSGEFIGKGAFMIYGKKNILRVDLNCAVGKTQDGLWMAGPRTAVEKHCPSFFLVTFGKDKPSDAAKTLRKKLGGEVDDIIRVLPPGSMKLVQIK
ncbi:MAG: NFACT RNA binding domain-containing protein [Nanoarchaeota archaeon]|mgnify:CR=1 FL=1